MKEVNLVSIVNAYNNFGKEKLYNKYLSFFGVSLKERELEDLKSFVDKIRANITSLKVLEGYYLGFTIPQISKEFDILRIGKKSVINIELKNEFTTEERIKKQLEQNKYYLSFLGKDTFHFTYVAKKNKLYKLENDDLKLTSFQELANLLSIQEVEEIENLERLFDPSNYLVSPFNSTDKFVNKGYFLTQQQEDIENKIINSVVNKDEQLFFTIKGGAGTGKTLLVYDIARELTDKGEKVLVIHCGNLNEGQEELKQKQILNIIPIKNIDLSKGFNFEDFTIVVLDETQRISKGQLDYIIKYTKGYVKKCIFSIDPIQCLRKSEFSNNIEEYIKNRVSVIENQLTDTIRTSEEILTFVKSILHNKKDFKKILYKNISLKYFTSLNFVTCDLKILKDKKVWKIINNTSSRHKREFDYEIPGESNSHKIIGQEFDNVVVVIDDSFYYDDKNKLSVKKEKESYYDKFGMLYQNITRARKKLNIVILNNKEVLERCLEVLNCSAPT
ncbi:DNA/RNA helicase domain-containing protein [Capnocytophaga leadbetteri]|uniref:DNA/RNA helicase domain-containing protein n=1 Tax=Capnocytophaga leadbetteri TaxID=327575 RepID=UPI00288AB103|nr:DNA/RNA helicase domain-containing protein [Capnocytophaga leadbetteri]